MDPNSANQQWSEWVFTVSVAPTGRARPFNEVKENVARFMRKGFGSAAQMNVERRRTKRGNVLWAFRVQAENANANDPQRRYYMQECVSDFMRVGFGPSAVTRMEVKLLAGRPEDGKPADQWLIMPPLDLLPKLWGDHNDQTQTLGLPTVPSESKALTPGQ